jgi:hypothetical protein
MRSKRILMGAAVIGCVATAMTSGAYAQQAGTNQQLNVRTGQQPPASARTGGSIRQGQGADTNAQVNARTGGNTQLNARSNGNATSANGQFVRRGQVNETRMGTGGRMGAESHMRAEGRMGTSTRGAYGRVSEERYGRGLRGERGLYAHAGVEGGYRRSHLGYRERAVDTGVGVAGTNSGYHGGYRGRRLYAYAPGYEAGVAATPRYSYAAPSYSYAAPRYNYGYAPGFDIGLNTGPYYAPAWNTAYAYDYAPGVNFGIGIGPVGIGLGPAWAW